MNLNSYLGLPLKINLYEPTPRLFKNLKKNFSSIKKILFYNKKFDGSKNKYNTILYLDVLEHIKDDQIEINKAFTSLNPITLPIIEAVKLAREPSSKRYSSYAIYAKY
jgi:2-polyprenyl-3-methyl-5-hydroxy-6-metoxy-1,4-benzoquinol methylase